MTVDEFLDKVRSQEVVTLERDVSTPGPRARALLASSRGSAIADSLDHPDRRTERRTLRYSHIVRPGLSAAELEDWQSRFRAFPLPEDLRRFLREANGVHLWADLERQRAYFGLLPLEDWTDVSAGPLGYVFDVPPRAALVISYQQDTAGFAVLDTAGPTYFWCDLIGRPEPIGTTVEDLLTHWWNRCRLDPRER